MKYGIVGLLEIPSHTMHNKNNNNNHTFRLWITFLELKDAVQRLTTS